MNILTFDIEEWYLEKILHGGRDYKYQQYDDMFGRLLAFLDEHGIKGTFFCVGKLATDFPDVIRQIASRGHEIGCHSNKHSWLNELDEDDLRRDTLESLKSLEDVSGQKVVSYRAPAFTITHKNKWAINVLADCGIESDASIFPTSRDIGGFKGFPQDTPCIISHERATLKEYPICLTSLLGKKTAYSGGGFFRILPYWFVSHTMQKRDYNICYFHLNDLIVQKFGFKSKAEFEEYYREPGTLKNRVLRYIKSNVGHGDAFAKLQRLLTDNSFVTICEADKEINWEKAKEIIL